MIMLLHQTPIEDILFIDIETIPVSENFNELEDNLKIALTHKFQKILNQQNSTKTISDLYNESAGIKSEYSKVLCIGLAVLHNTEQGLAIKGKIIGCADIMQTEYDVLKEFAELIQTKYQDKKKLVFCGHNISEFDIPFLCRRMLINGIAIPPKMNFQGLKPWEVKILDTMNLWKFGDIKHSVSIDLLCAVFNIPTPKKTMSGAQVKEVFYKEQDLEKIRKYCMHDVVAVVQLLLKYNYADLIPELQVNFKY